MKFSKLTLQDQLYKSRFGEVDVHHFMIVTYEGDKVGRVIGSLAQLGQYYLAAEVGSWLLRREIAIPLSDYRLLSQQRQISLSSVDHDRAVDLVPGQVLAEPLAADLALPAAQQPVTAQPAKSTSQLKADDFKADDLGQIRLFEERVAVDMQRRKLGEVIVRKVVETEIIEIPVRREKLVIEQVSPTVQQLAVVDLSQLSAVELYSQSGMGANASSNTGGNINAHNSDNANTNSNRSQLLDSSSSRASLQAIPMAQATKILIHLSQNPEFSSADVKLQFEDPLLQAHYQRWLSQE